jgi:hypothetical protein
VFLLQKKATSHCQDDLYFLSSWPLHWGHLWSSDFESFSIWNGCVFIRKSVRSLMQTIEHSFFGVCNKCFRFTILFVGITLHFCYFCNFLKYRRLGNIFIS